MNNLEQDRRKIISVLQELYAMDGEAYQSLDRVSQLSGIPKEKLYNWNEDTGIMLDLEFDDVVSIMHGKNPCFCLSPSSLDE